MNTAAQHVWLRDDATSYEAECEACLYAREAVPRREAQVTGTLRLYADVAFTSCRRGHRIVVRRIGRIGASAA
jgi:hypothetical protein